MELTSPSSNLHCINILGISIEHKIIWSRVTCGHFTMKSYIYCFEDMGWKLCFPVLPASFTVRVQNRVQFLLKLVALNAEYIRFWFFIWGRFFFFFFSFCFVLMSANCCTILILSVLTYFKTYLLFCIWKKASISKKTPNCCLQRTFSVTVCISCCSVVSLDILWSSFSKSLFGSFMKTISNVFPIFKFFFLEVVFCMHDGDWC